jgi:hypothetical protein
LSSIARPYSFSVSDQFQSQNFIYARQYDQALAQQVLEDAGIKSFIFKDDAGGMEPQLQLTNGVRLVVSRADAESAYQIIQTFDSAL